MKAPDRVYIETYAGEVFSSKWTTTPLYIENTEYIRKDALIEWAKENIDSLGRLSYGELIDKLNSM